MKRTVRQTLSQLRRAQDGFTLVELLVVVGIIVALSAVMVPSVAQFANKGDVGAQNAELQNVQAAIDSYMANAGVTTVTALNLATDTSTNTFGAGATLDLTGYLRETTTTFYYCWDGAGLIKSQDTAAAADCTNAGDGAR